MASPTIVILAALAAEHRAIAARVPREVRVHTIGPRAGFLPQLPDADHIILAGLAGGLDPALAAGDVVVQHAVPRLSLPPTFRTGRIHTADRIVSTPGEKRQVFERTRAAAVDMEQAVVAAALAPRPVIGLRVVFDTAGEALPAFVSDLVTSRGGSRPVRALLHVLRRPSRATELIWLARRSELALSRLGAAAAELVAHLAS